MIFSLIMDKLTVGPRKIVRAPNLRRGREIIPISDRVKLEKVLGLTVSNNSAFDCDPISGIVAYPAGCVIVVYNVRKNKQSHILSSSKKTITSLAFSSDGKYLATGECGHQPHVRVWDVQERVQVAEFQGHKYGINCVAFSPNLKYVVSVGSQHDMIVNVWDWRNNIKVASNKVSCKVKALSFASNGSYFVTVGNRHVKFWYLEYSRSTKYHKLDPVPLMGRSAILGDQRNNSFCDVACGKGEMGESTYAITKSGLLCEFNSRRLLDKWVELRTSRANSISVGENLIIIGCAEGVIRCFSPYNLNFIVTLPRPHYLGIDVAKNLRSFSKPPAHVSNTKYPDTIAIALDEINKKVTCVYNDHSFYVWDIKDIKKVGKSHSFMYHSTCIWGIEIYPDLPNNSKNILPKGTFLTCSSDDTIRFWNSEPNIEQDTSYHRNIYSSELLKILYIDPDLSYLCDTDFNTSGSNDKVDTTCDGKNGVRCLRISPEGKHLASGDRSGNIRIYDLEIVEEICKIEAHDSEVLCLEYSKPIIIAGQEKKYLASASRDRLIHVFDVKQDYSFQQTLDDHSSSITAVRFVQNGDLLQMISCGADKSIIFRKAFFNPQLSLAREHHVVGKTTLYDMEVDVQQKHILTACQDRNIRVYSVANGKHGRCFRGSQGEDGTLIKVILDSSGTYLATSCTDKSLYLYDYITGECLATMFGHSELVTGLKFTNDGKHLISVSGDGCIFLWKLPVEVTQNMLNKQITSDGLPSLWQDRRSAVAVTKPLQLMENSTDEKIQDDNLDLISTNNKDIEITPPGYRFSIGQLPLWAKKNCAQMNDKLAESSNSNNQNLPPPIPPRGRWAQRIEGQGLVMRSYLDSDSVLPFPNFPVQSDTSSQQDKEEKINPELSNFSGNKDVFEVSEQSRQEIFSESTVEESNIRVTLQRTIDSFNSANNQRDRLRSLSNSSNIRMEEIDAEDERSDSEISEMVYYPASEEGSDVADSSFHVCANNDELGKEAMNQTKKRHSEHILNDVPIINTPENETNSDDDEASTLVDSERSFLGSLCISTENLEKLGQREKFMKSNYESLEKNEDEIHNNEAENKTIYRQSISAKFLAGSLTPRSTITNKANAVPECKTSTTTKKREELLKALSDAKKKLETVGYKGGLSSSKSIADLHSTPDREIFKRPNSENFNRDIRKAASMTDLSINVYNRRLSTTPVKSKDKFESEPTAPLWNQTQIYPVDTSFPTSPKPHLFKTPNQSPIKPDNENSESMSRSISTSCLNAKNQIVIAPLHKTNSSSPLDRTSPQPIGSNLSLPSKSLIGLAGRPYLPSLPMKYQRSNMAISTSNPADSSSDSSPTELASPKNRPIASPRPFGSRTRYFSLSENANNQEKHSLHHPYSNDSMQKFKSRSEWDLKNSLQEDISKNSNDSNQNNCYLSYSPRRNNMQVRKLNHSSSSHNLSSSNNLQRLDNGRNLSSFPDFSLFGSDPASVPLTLEVCQNIADNLLHVTSFAMHIFQKLTLSTDLPSKEKCAMTNTLAQGVWQAQQTLSPAIPPLNTRSNSMENLYECNSKRSQGFNFQPNGEVNEVPLQRFMQSPQPDTLTAALLQQYSDKLLSIVEQKLADNSQNKTNGN